MAYTEQEIINKLENAIRNLNLLYKSDVVNYSGKTKITRKPYVEVSSNYIFNNFDKIFGKDGNKIRRIDRTQGYYVEGHDGIIRKFTNREEEILAKALYLQEIPGLGVVFDYQVPLQHVDNDSGVGKIDMVSIDENGKISIIELKTDFSKDTLLKCALQVYTYSKQINKKIFINDITNHYVNKFNENNILRVYFNRFVNEVNKLEKIQSVVLIFEGSAPANMVDPNTYPKTIDLVKKLGVKVYVYPPDIEFTASAKFQKPKIY